eukprot:10861187-Alexandrium_andersonii.AAC.1
MRPNRVHRDTARATSTRQCAHASCSASSTHHATTQRIASGSGDCGGGWQWQRWPVATVALFFVLTRALRAARG